ncbi:MAG: hypothetical protein IKL73_06120 [Lachnospiraceae bacterium]|nr:hypothetical protein [Lachnospiraceae bacterium]
MKLTKELKLQYKKIFRKKLISKSYALIPIGIAAALFALNILNAFIAFDVKKIKGNMSNYDNCYFFVQDFYKVGEFLTKDITHITDEERKQGIFNLANKVYPSWRESIMGTDISKYDLVGLQVSGKEHEIVSSGHFTYTNFSEDVNEVVCVKGNSKIGDIIEINGCQLKVIDVVLKDIYFQGTFSGKYELNFAKMLGYEKDTSAKNLYILHPKNTALETQTTRAVYCFNPLDYTQEEMAKMEEYGKIYSFAQLENGCPKQMSLFIGIVSYVLLVAFYVMYLVVMRNAIKKELYIFRLYDIPYNKFLNRLHYNACIVMFLSAYLGAIFSSVVTMMYVILVQILLVVAFIIAILIFKKYDAVAVKKIQCEKCEAIFNNLSILDNIEYIYNLKNIKNNVNAQRLLRVIPVTPNIYDLPETLDYYNTCTLCFLREVAISMDEVIYADDFWKNCSRDEHKRAEHIVELTESYVNKDIKVDWMY